MSHVPTSRSPVLSSPSQSLAGALDLFISSHLHRGSAGLRSVNDLMAERATWGGTHWSVSVCVEEGGGGDMVTHIWRSELSFI